MTLNNRGVIKSLSNGIDLENVDFNNLPGGLFEATAGTVRAVNSPDQSINNTGTLRKIGTQAYAFEVPFNNSGTVEVQSGSLEFRSGYTQVQGVLRSVGGSISSTGFLDLGGGAIDMQTGALTLGKGTLTAGSIQIGAGATMTVHGGEFRMTGAATMTVHGGVAIQTASTSTDGVLAVSGGGNLTVEGKGTLTVTGGGDLVVDVGGKATFNLPAGGVHLPSHLAALRPNGTVINTGLMNITAGGISGTGTLANHGSIRITSAGGSLGTPQLIGATLNNHGTITHTAGPAQWQGFTLNNQPGGLYDFAGDGSISFFATVAQQFNNAGTLRKSVGAGVSAIQVQVNNTGAVEAQSGTLGFQAGYVQTQGTVGLMGGSVSSSQPMQLEGGALFGNGTVTGDLVNNGGAISIGSSPGSIQLNGKYTQGRNGVLTIEIGGAAPATQFDQFNVSGPVVLDGTLNIQRVNAFDPAVNDAFPVLTYASRVGGFAEVNGQFISPTKAFQLENGANNLTLRAVPAADLRVTAISSSPATLVPGQNVTVNYTVQNLSSPTSAGSWTDSVFLSRDNTLDPFDALIGRITHTGDVATSGAYSETLTALLPPAIPGDYRLLVRADSSELVADANEANNLGFSNLVAVDVPVLPLNTMLTGTIASGEMKFFRLDIQAGKDAIVRASFGKAGAAELLVRYVLMPDRSTFDQRAFSPTDPTQFVIWSGPQTGDYFVLLAGQPAAGAGTSFTLFGEQKDFDLLSVSRTQGSNLGATTLKVTGIGLTPNTQLTLSGPSGVARTAGLVRYQGANTLLATFDLSGLPEGVYDVQASNAIRSDTLPQAFSVITGTPGQLMLSLTTPSSTRESREGFVTLNYSNSGDTDIQAPLLMLSATNAVLKLAEQSDFLGNTLQFLAINPTDLPGVLPAGFTGQLRIDFRHTGSDLSGVEFSLDRLIPETVLNWEVGKNELKPGHVSDAAWDAIFANFVREAGTTLGQYQSLMIDNANYLAQLGVYSADVGRLLSFELQQADGFGTLSARLEPGRFGPGMADPFGDRLLVRPNGDVAVLSQNRIHEFRRRPDGGFEGVPGNFAALTLGPSGEFQLRDLDGTLTVYRPDGTFDFVEDTNGNRVSAGYTDGRRTSLTRTNGDVINLAYDTQGRVTEMTLETGEVIRYTYDPATGRVASITDSQGTTEFSYLSGQGLTRDGALARITAPDGRSLFLEYDDRGRLIGQSNDGGALPMTFVYDSTGGVTGTNAAGTRLRVMRNEDGQVARQIDAQGNITSFLFNSEDQLSKVTLPGRLTVTQEYDTLGNLVRVIAPSGKQTQFTFVPSTDLVSGLRDARGNLYTQLYDARRNASAVIFPDGTTERYSYDERGNLVSIVNRKGDGVTLTYDGKDQRTSRTRPGGVIETFTYNDDRLVTSVTDATGVTMFQYDSAKRLQRLAYPSGRFLEFAYDAVGRRTRMTDHEGNVVQYHYNGIGLLERITDGAGNLIVGHAYDAAGRKIRVDRVNGTSTSFEYDARDQVGSIVHRAPDGAVQERFDYTYNNLGWLTSRSSLAGAENFEYDANGQLTGVTLPDGRVIHYGYDAEGNRTSVTDSGIATDYTVNNLNQYLTKGAATFGYDLAGNQISRTDAMGTTLYTYDDLQRLIGVAEPGGSTWAYEYNALGQRVAAVRNGVRTEFLVDLEFSDNVVAEYDATGQRIARYVHGTGLESRIDAGGQAFYAFDGMANTALLTGAGGRVLNAYRYAPFGEILSQTEAVVNGYRFVGQFGGRDAGNGLHFMRARYYQADLGRFTAADPIGFAGLQNNLYTYVDNAPTLGIDPQGTAEISSVERADLHQCRHLVQQLPRLER